MHFYLDKKKLRYAVTNVGRRNVELSDKLVPKLRNLPKRSKVIELTLLRHFYFQLMKTKLRESRVKLLFSL